MNILRPSIALILAASATTACSGTTPKAGESTGSSAQAVKTTSVFHSTQNGGGAQGSVFHYDQDTQAMYSLQFEAWENQSAQGRTASLALYGYGATTQQVCYDEMLCSSWDYNTWTCNAWEAVHWCYYQQIPYYIYGYGDIPTDDFRVGVHAAHLTTDLASDTSFTAMRCGYDGNWSYSCTPITGTIDVTWRDNGFSSSDEQGTSFKSMSSPWGSFSMRSIGHWSSTSADVSGTVLGDAPSSGGSISLNRDTTIMKDAMQGSSSDGGLPPPPMPPPPGPDGG